MARFIIKQKQERIPAKKYVSSNNNIQENKSVMNTAEKVAMANEILAQQENEPKQSVKKLKKDKGLIERTESSKTIITEDNKELLIG